MSKKESQSLKGLNCSWCGKEISQDWVERDVFNPGNKVVIEIQLCDECWQTYKEGSK